MRQAIPSLIRKTISILPLLALSALVASPASANQVHVVAQGHTLAKIAKRYRTSVEALRETNQLAPGTRLSLGQKIIIPTSEPDLQSTSPHALATATSHRNGRENTNAPSAFARSTDVAAQSLRNKSGSYAKRPPHPGVIHLIRENESWIGRPLTRQRKPDPSALDNFRRLLRDGDSGASKRIDPRLIAAVVKVSNRFGGRPIEIVSGFREPEPDQHASHSNHNDGRAMDFRIRGVPNEAVRDFCHGLTGVGVGYYPNSTFVHLDVRGITTHWTDRSGPGEPPNYSSVVQGPQVKREAPQTVAAQRRPAPSPRPKTRLPLEEPSTPDNAPISL